MTFSRSRIILAGLSLVLMAISAPAEAKIKKNHNPSHRAHYTRIATETGAEPACVNEGRCQVGSISFSSSAPSGRSQRVLVAESGINFIPSPEGCHRVSVSCACRLAAYWGLGSGLDKVSTWPQVFARASGPGYGIAAIRSDRHHIMGIVGGSAGAWQVVDFNSGRHLNRSYVVADFRGYFFVDPRMRIASR